MVKSERSVSNVVSISLLILVVFVLSAGVFIIVSGQVDTVEEGETSAIQVNVGAQEADVQAISEPEGKLIVKSNGLRFGTLQSVGETTTVPVDNGDAINVIQKIEGEERLLISREIRGVNRVDYTSISTTLGWRKVERNKFTGGTGTEIEILSNGNSVVVGTTDTTAFVRSYSSSGNLLWEDSIAGYDSPYGTGFYSVAARDGDIYVLGTVADASGDEDLYLAKYDSSGSKKWAEQYDTGKDERGLGVTIGKNGDVYVVGLEVSNSGSQRFILKYSSSGVQKWKKTPSFGGGYTPTDIDVGPTGNLYVAGYTSYINNNGYITNNPSHHFIARYEQSGNLVWKNIDNSDGTQEYIERIQVTETGKMYAVGYASKSSYDVYVLRGAPSDGSITWTRTWDGENAGDYAYGLSVDKNGNLFIGATRIDASGDSDVVLLGYNENGNKFWKYTYDSGKRDSGADVAVSSSDIYYTGRTDYNNYDNSHLIVAKRKITDKK